MKAAQQPLLGILGGMGPLATVDFLGKLTSLTTASRDQDHLPWIAFSQPGTPDRSTAIREGSGEPGAYLTAGVAHLAAQGVKLIAVPCSTSHFWYEQMQAASPAPILHIADATVEELRQHRERPTGPIAILATRGTVASGIYSTRLRAADFEPFPLGEPEQFAVDRAIDEVKRGNCEAARREMRDLQKKLAASGAKKIILACTELPLAYDDSGALPAVDVSHALAKACLRRLGYLR